MNYSFAPEPVARAALQVLHVAAYTTRNWTVNDTVPRKQINALWEAIHEVPAVVANWRSDEESLEELRAYFREYDEKYTDLGLGLRFEHALLECQP
jgi:hypothetical protein